MASIRAALAGVTFLHRLILQSANLSVATIAGT